MSKNDFRKQIKDDLQDYKEAHPNIENIMKDEWAFNYWVLDRLYGEDEDEIENKIIDYKDFGVDCYVWHAETLDLYLIQNKLYGDSSILDTGYVRSTLNDAYGQLIADSFVKSPEIQSIFNKYKDNPDFIIHHCFYVTNNKVPESARKCISEFNHKYDKRDASIYDLEDIQEAYYGEPNTEKKNLTIELCTVNKGTRLAINSEEYGMDLPIDGIYAMVPVWNLYEALVRANAAGYPMFDSNIREFLGHGGKINKRIVETLQSPLDRNNFFYYNNGITIICEKIENEGFGKGSGDSASYRKFDIRNPQIVNGCQTVSSIEHVLKDTPDDLLRTDFKDVFVMAKILELPSDDVKMTTLRDNIVKYNNSQNSIDEKTFEAINGTFARIQIEFRKRGFLLLLKQSDAHKFAEEFKKPSKLLDLNKDLLAKYGLTNVLTTTKKLEIKLDKLLQILLAFYGDAQQAFQKKGNLLKKDSAQYKTVTDALRDSDLTIERLLNMCLLYLRVESEKKDNQEDGKIPITWYMFEGMAAIECNGKDLDLFDKIVESNDKVDELIVRYTRATRMYYKNYQKENDGKGYNAMIKEKLDVEFLRNCIEITS